MFHNSSQVIMNLDSRISQLEARDCMLLISTLTRCYICNTAAEQYRQIGQKLRDGEFGACFVNKDKPTVNGGIEKSSQDFTEAKKYNIVDDDAAFCVNEEFANTLIYCARPSSRLWEATIDGLVRRTHQFKQVLAKYPMKPVTVDSYENDDFSIDNTDGETKEQSVNFCKIYSVNSAIFSFSKHALYFLNIQDVDDTVWYFYKEIVDCKIYQDIIYVWFANGSLLNLKFMKLDKFLLKCYIDEKYVTCAKLCTFYSDYLLSNNISPKLHILTGLKDKLQSNGLLENLDSLLNKFGGLKSNEATQMKSGIYVVDNTYHTQSMLDESIDKKYEDDSFANISPEAIQTLKGISVTVTDKLNSSKKILKEKWEDFEGKMKHLGIDKQLGKDSCPEKVVGPKWVARDEYSLNENTPVLVTNDIVYTDSSQKAIEIDNNHSLENEEACKTLFQYSRLSLGSKESDMSNLTSIIETNTCDIHQIHSLMLSLEKYCLSIGAVEDAKFVPNKIFLTYLNASSHDILDVIIKDEVLYKYFVDSCISVNVKIQKIANLGCECGFPLPYVRTSQMPVFPDLIDEFIERQWSSQSREQCYEICKRMPYLWRKILYLRRNEDLLNVLRILLQMLDESLLHSFLPQFTLESWERAVQLYATLHANICLNCNKKFDNISVKDMLSWDDLGLLIIKSVGGRHAIKVMQKYSNLIELGAVTIKFYHACLLTSLFEKYDATITIPLADTVYSSYELDDCHKEICKLLRSSLDGNLKNTALPLIVAAKSRHWGLEDVYERLISSNQPINQKEVLNDILDSLANINNIVDCCLCGLPLQNEILFEDGGLWVFKCGHTFHGACLNLNKVKLCPSCSVK